MVQNTQRKLNIFSDFSLVRENEDPVTLLYPFCRKGKDNSPVTVSDEMRTYSRAGNSFFHFSSLEEADLAVFPIRWEHIAVNKKRYPVFETFNDRVHECGIPTVIFFISDSDPPVPGKNLVVFKTSIHRSTRKTNEFAMPAWEESILEKYFSGNLQVRKKENKATLGFVGHVPRHSYIRDIYNKTETFFRFKSPLKGPFSNIRSEAMDVFSKSERVHKNFVIRDNFWGMQRNPAIKKREKLEFIENMISSDYILCARGGGNYSYRFYETLSCGRIPLFIDTDSVLPYDFEINYKDYCVWVDQNELASADKILGDFHEHISDEDFISLQYRCRRLWQEYLSPEGFFANFYKHFKIA